MVRIRLKVLLAELEITQQELAAMTGIKQPIISSYCRNQAKNLSLDNIDVICKVLHCRIDQLLEYIDDKNNTTEN